MDIITLLKTAASRLEAAIVELECEAESCYKIGDNARGNVCCDSAFDLNLMGINLDTKIDRIAAMLNKNPRKVT